MEQNILLYEVKELKMNKAFTIFGFEKEIEG